MKIWFASGAVGLALLAQARPAHAYWDDVHYHLTYLTARLVGCTPEQSYRLAAANVSTDYATATEPTQFSLMDYVGTTKGNDPDRQSPRWRFHAFRNQTVPAYANAIGNGPGAAAADAAITAQANALFRQGVASKNIGVFLHYAQDREPHRGFGSGWGHYYDPFDPVGSTAQARKDGLVLGGSVDWISHHSKLVTVNVLYNTGSWIDKFIASASPRQQRRSLGLADSDNMIDAIRQSSPAPAGLTAAELPLYQQFVAKAHGAGNAPKLTAAQTAKFNAHHHGPNLAKAEALVVAQMKTLGMMEGSIPPLAGAQKKYALSAAGAPPASQLDSWVVVGSLEVTVQGKSENDTEPVDVIIKAPITRTGETEYDLVPITKMKPGEAQTFDNIPVGEVIIEVQRKGKALHNERIKLLKRQDKKTIKLTDKGLSGRWSTNQGWILTLTQDGDNVSGNYRGQGGVSGTVAGVLKGGVFSGTYVHREGNSTYRGVFTSQLVGDNKLDGVWTETEHNVSENIVATRE